MSPILMRRRADTQSHGPLSGWDCPSVWLGLPPAELAPMLQCTGVGRHRSGFGRAILPFPSQTLTVSHDTAFPFPDFSLKELIRLFAMRVLTCMIT